MKLWIPAEVYRGLLSHLDAGGGEDDDAVEQVAFLFTEPYEDGADTLRVTSMYPVPPEGFQIQTGYHVSLTDEVRAYVIKRAWDEDACLVEVHSHEHGGPVAFSGSDLWGFRDWVPHVSWRLRGRPYTALVFSRDTVDALVWVADPAQPAALEAVEIENGTVLSPTNRTLIEQRIGDYGD